MLTKIVFNHLT